MNRSERAKIVIVNLCRIVLGLTFVVSGFVKAIDPHGTQYKFEDYLSSLGMNGVIPDSLLLIGAVALSTFEFALGVFILVAIQRRFVSKLSVAFMAVMTLVTLWIFIANPVQDCGCFGDAIVLSNGATLLKNIILLACALCLAYMPLYIKRFMSKNTQWIVIHSTIIALITLSAWCLYDLPIIDFRPYYVGADIIKGMEIPADAEQPQYETTFILEKEGERKEFYLDNYPDSTWTFIDSKTVTIKEGYQPPIHDFSINTLNGDDITDMVLESKMCTFLLISPTLAQADDSNFGDIDELYEYAQDNNCRFICLTASSDKEINRWIDITGAEYEFCRTDGTTLKTIVRSNPGLLLLKKGVIVGKWSHNRLPDAEELKTLLK